MENGNPEEPLSSNYILISPSHFSGPEIIIALSDNIKDLGTDMLNTGRKLDNVDKNENINTYNTSMNEIISKGLELLAYYSGKGKVGDRILVNGKESLFSLPEKEVIELQNSFL